MLNQEDRRWCKWECAEAAGWKNCSQLRVGRAQEGSDSSVDEEKTEAVELSGQDDATRGGSQAILRVIAFEVEMTKESIQYVP